MIADRDRVRRASAVSVQLASPGMMSLLALIGPGELAAVAGRRSGVTSVLAVGLLGAWFMLFAEALEESSGQGPTSETNSRPWWVPSPRGTRNPSRVAAPPAASARALRACLVRGTIR